MFSGKCLEYVLGDLFFPRMGHYDILRQENERQTSQEILEEYREADGKKRDHMWFMFRGLREKFDDLETAKK